MNKFKKMVAGVSVVVFVFIMAVNASGTLWGDDSHSFKANTALLSAKAAEKNYELQSFGMEKTYYVCTPGLNVRSTPSLSENNIVNVLSYNDEVKVLGQVENEGVTFYYYGSEDQPQFISSKYLKINKQEQMTQVGMTQEQSKQLSEQQNSVPENTWTGEKLNRTNGRVYGPMGYETYYNLPMDGVVRIMRSMGNNDPYWVRSDGAKMLGNYVMVAADLSKFPRGSHVQTSLGPGIVCDTGSFFLTADTVFDVAVVW